jgi:3-deoxy-D-manno-octulosonic-acid transferase
MLLIYNIAIRFYYLIIFIYSFFNTKARQFINGRRQQKVTQITKSIWFHFASLGEFEQGRPVLEKIKQQHPSASIVITFFSPSGYEVRKNTPLADAVYYLPLDTEKNARQFIATINPEMAIFTKYEYWYHFFKALKVNNIPLYIISGIFRPDQVFFKWYGGLHRKILRMVFRFFVQDENSKQLLAEININNVSVSGDTRFDRVWENALHPKPIQVIENFKNGSKVLIGGSTWPPDEEIIASIIGAYPEWKFIFAPHEIHEDKIAKLLSLLPADQTIRFSQIKDLTSPLAGYRILIIDNIGMLSSLYQYGEIAFIGGGFGVGIHNTLEAAAFGLPVIIGPNYERFREARELVQIQAAFAVNNVADFKNAVSRLIDQDEYIPIGAKAREYTSTHTGATATIINFIKTNSGN